MKDKQKVIDTIAKLMALAMDSGATPAERDNAMEKATRIMVKHNIAQAEVNPKEKVEANGAEMTGLNLFEGDIWEIMLGVSIARVFDCKPVTEHDRSQIYFFGLKDDLDITVYFYNRLLRYISSMSMKAYPHGPNGFKRKMRSYCRGVQMKVSKRLEELYKKVQEIIPSECRDLVVVKEKVVGDKIKSEFPSLRKLQSQARPDMDAYRKGFDDGDSVPLHSNREQVRNSG
jgi:hypothetical protein